MPRSVDLKPLSETEFEQYVDTVTAGYAVELAESVGLPPKEAEDAAAAHIAQVLSAGPESTSAFHFVDAEHGRAIGSAWLLTKQGDAFLADLRIDDEFRGQGYGTAAMARLEAHLKENGYPAFRLHVYAKNAAARALYDKLGFEVVSMQMRKSL